MKIFSWKWILMPVGISAAKGFLGNGERAEDVDYGYFFVPLANQGIV
jgi:hypothetical protein